MKNSRISTLGTLVLTCDAGRGKLEHVAVTHAFVFVELQLVPSFLTTCAHVDRCAFTNAILKRGLCWWENKPNDQILIGV